MLHGTEWNCWHAWELSLSTENDSLTFFSSIYKLRQFHMHIWWILDVFSPLPSVISLPQAIISQTLSINFMLFCICSDFSFVFLLAWGIDCFYLFPWGVALVCSFKFVLFKFTLAFSSSWLYTSPVELLLVCAISILVCVKLCCFPSPFCFFLWLTDYSRAYYLLSIWIFHFASCYWFLVAFTIVFRKDVWYDSSLPKVVKICFVA